MGAGRTDEIRARAEADGVPFGVARRRVLIEAGELLPSITEAVQGYRAIGPEAKAKADALIVATAKAMPPSPAAVGRVAAITRKLEKGRA